MLMAMKGSATEVLSLLSVKEGQFLPAQWSVERRAEKRLVKQEKDEVQNFANMDDEEHYTGSCKRTQEAL